ncbi:MAG TPA: DUF6600 domain-containing protein [Patescibacteria group bacterium]|nr:DUF6600 domain-containing protein [Patescibacteria group bacterium]
MNRTLVIAGILSIAALWPLTASADPPARVGRLSYVEGTVSTRTGNQDQWNNAVLNVPVTTGDGFWTEDDGRTEIQVGGMEIRTDHDTELDVVQLDDDTTRLEVPQGVINVHIDDMPAGGISIATPAGETTLNSPGNYRVDAGQPQGNQPGQTEYVAVMDGSAMFSGPHASVNINAGEQAVLNGNPPSAGVERVSMTDFDNWAESRNPRVRVSSHERRHVPVQVTGYQDLDRYGRWESDPQYGEVWYPEAVSADWAPYREGYWSYVEPWGWTWIDDEPWGFAPYHYGRWMHRHNHWAWYPGSYHEASPVYAPALVAFVGGRNWGVSLSLGDSEPVGWVPLAPDEPFYPYYRTSDRYRVNINRTTVNKTVINNITVNNNGTINTTGGTLTAARLANRDAVTVVRANDFRRGARADRTAIKVAGTAIASAPVATPQVAGIQPTAEARGGAGAARANRANRQAPRPPERSAWREQRRQNRLNAQQSTAGATTPNTQAGTMPTATPAQGAANTANQTNAAPAPQLSPAEQRREQRQLERQGRAAENSGINARRGPHQINRHEAASEPVTAKPETQTASPPANVAAPGAVAPGSTANEAAAAPDTRVPNPAEQRREQREQRQLQLQGRADEAAGRHGHRGPHEVVNQPAQTTPADETAAKPDAQAGTTAPAPAVATPPPAPRNESANEPEQVQPRRERLREPPIANSSGAREERRGLAEPLIEPSAGGRMNSERRAGRGNRPDAQDRASVRSRGPHEKNKRDKKDEEEQRANQR